MLAVRADERVHRPVETACSKCFRFAFAGAETGAPEQPLGFERDEVLPCRRRSTAASLTPVIGMPESLVVPQKREGPRGAGPFPFRAVAPKRYDPLVPSPPIVPSDGVMPRPESAGADEPERLVPDRALELRVRDDAFRRVPPERLLVFFRPVDERLLVFLRPVERLAVFFRAPDERELVFLRPPERDAVFRVPDERELVFLRPPDERLLVFLRAPVERLLVFLRVPVERDVVFLRPVERDVVFLRPVERDVVFLRPPADRLVVFFRPRWTGSSSSSDRR